MNCQLIKKQQLINLLILNSSRSVVEPCGRSLAGPSSYLLVVLLVPEPLDLGVVDGQLPAVGLAQLVAAAAEQRLPLGRHRLQGGQHRAAALRPAGLTAHVQRAAAVVVQLGHRTLTETHNTTPRLSSLTTRSFEFKS